MPAREISGSLRQWAVRHFPARLHPLAREAVFTGTRSVGNLLRSLPGDSRNFGPPRRIAATLADYARSHPETVAYHELYPEHDLRRSLPLAQQADIHPAFLDELHRRAWASGVGLLKNGRVVTNFGAIVSADDALIYDVSHTAANDDPRAHPIFLERRLPRLSRFDGRLAVLTTFASNVPQMYYFVHWLLDALPRLHLIEKSGAAWDKLVAPQATRIHRDTLALLGVASDRIISDRDLYIEAESLVVPTLPGLPVNPPRWACDYLRDKFIPMALESARRLNFGRRIYLSRARAKTRRIANEAEFLAAIEPKGFERVFLEDYPFLEQVRIMQEAAVVVAPHGAANASLVFANPQTVFVEMFSPRYVNVCYWSLANQVGIRYGYVTEGAPGPRQAHADITTPVHEVLHMVDRLAG
jgi:capsular polysaccharide biosynthesis protein